MVNSAFHRRTKGPGETRRARAASASDLGPRTSDLGHGFLRDASESAATAPGVWLQPWEREQRGAPTPQSKERGLRGDQHVAVLIPVSRREKTCHRCHPPAPTLLIPDVRVPVGRDEGEREWDEWCATGLFFSYCLLSHPCNVLT